MTRTILIILLNILVLSACQIKQNESTKFVKDEFWGKGENSDVPQSWESVCVDSAQHCGDTHLSIDNNHVAVSFTLYKDPDEAIQKLNELKKNSIKVLEAGSIKNSDGNIVGEKVLVYRSSGNEKYYSLIWTRNARLTELLSESWDAIKRYEKDRNL